MNAALLQALALNEVRLRSRRTSTLVILGVVVLLSWLMVLDPQSGHAMMVSERQRFAYDSQALAFGTTVLACVLFGLAGFYLARGRSALDLRHGTAAVVAATPVGNAPLLLARWLGAFGFLLLLGTALMLTIWVLQLVRGEGPLQPWPYLLMLLLGLAPVLMLCASLAVLADAWAPLMGKRGDLLYWAFWIAQFAFLPATLGGSEKVLSAWQVLDVSGLSPLLVAVSRLANVQSLSVGGGPFDPSLPLRHLPEGLWTAELVLLRLGAMGVALLPLGLAVLAFHRYDPDRTKRLQPGSRGGAAGRWSRLRAGLLRPWTRLLGGLLRAGAHVPGLGGRLLADLGLLLLAQPVLALVMLGAAAASAALPLAQLPAALAVGLAAWGIAVADLHPRDHQHGTWALASAAPGGAAERVLRQGAVTLGLGFAVAAPTLLRWLDAAPLRAAACAAGVLAVGSVALLLGRLTQGGRSFLALFLFALYLNLQRTGLPALDLFGLAGDATLGSAAGFAIAALGAGLALRWAPRR